MIRKIKNILSSPLIFGTLLLTFSGVVCRVIGFFYRIFLSRTIGAEALGLYQLVFPIAGLCFALSAAGIQTSLSRYVAEASGSSTPDALSPLLSKRYLYAGLFLSCSLSFFCAFFIHNNADTIATLILGDARCAPLLQIISYSLIPSAIHACFNGYYYGQKKTVVPAVSQFFEQLARVFFVYLVYVIQTQKNGEITAAHATWGLVAGELAALLVCLTGAAWDKNNAFSLKQLSFSSQARLLGRSLKTILQLAIPLTLNQTLVHLFSSLENLLIPRQLHLYGYTNSEALSIYGVLSGMVISVIYFPCVLTNSISVLLLPTVSEAQATHNDKKIRSTVTRAVVYGLLIGFLCTFAFLFFGDFIGNVIFQNELAATLIKRLSFLCPMMYVFSMLSSILHGLGKAKTVLFINLQSSLLRIGFLWFLVPIHGLSMVLWSMLLGQLFCAVGAMISLFRALE